MGAGGRPAGEGCSAPPWGTEGWLPACPEPLFSVCLLLDVKATFWLRVGLTFSSGEPAGGTGQHSSLRPGVARRGGCLRGHLRSRLRSGFAQRILSCASAVANLSQSGCAVLFFLQTTFSFFLFEICISFIGHVSPSVQFAHGELVHSQVLKPSPVRLRKEPSPRPSASATPHPRGLPAPHTRALPACPGRLPAPPPTIGLCWVLRRNGSGAQFAVLRMWPLALDVSLRSQLRATAISSAGCAGGGDAPRGLDRPSCLSTLSLLRGRLV